ncbi:HicB family protein [Candidatus Pacearchaeota archaeon]|nr:HicB family protein [Candidatus Pacearchaeota archaeon]
MGKSYLDVVLNKELLGNGEEIFVANCTILGIASQGKTMDAAMKNIREVIDAYLEEHPELFDELSGNIPSFSVIELDKDAKATNIIGQGHD